MVPLDPGQILELWDWGVERGPIDRALGVLACACPDLDPSSAASLPVGRRDARLLALLGMSFGGEIEGRARCPACTAELEFSAAPGALGGDADARQAEDTAGELDCDGYHVRFRQPDSRDIAALTAAASSGEARTLLLSVIVESAAHRGAPVGASELPTEVSHALAARLERDDPQLAISIGLDCPDCATHWSATLDPVDFVWAAVESAAGRVVHEVSALARGYGWREADILAMSQRRRNAYLEALPR